MAPASLPSVLLPLAPCRFLTSFAAAAIYHLSYCLLRLLTISVGVGFVSSVLVCSHSINIITPLS